MHPDLNVLADPTRRTMLALLTLEQELCVCELEVALDQLQPIVSRQLAILRNAEWLDARRDGRRIYYRIGDVPPWARTILNGLTSGGVPPEDLRAARQRIADFVDRPIRLLRNAS